MIEPVRDSATLKNVIELFPKAPSNRCDPKTPQVGQFKLFDHVHSWTKSKKIALSSPAQILTPENLSEVLDSPPCFCFRWTALPKKIQRGGNSWQELIRNFDTRY